MGKSVRITSDGEDDPFMLGVKKPAKKAETPVLEKEAPVKKTEGDPFMLGVEVKKKEPSTPELPTPSEPPAIEPESGTKPISPSRFPLSQSPAKERHQIVEDLDAGSLLNSYKEKSKQTLEDVVNNPFGGSIQATQYAQSREGKTGKIVADIIEKGDFNFEDIKYLTEAAPKAAAQLISTVLPDADKNNLLSAQNIDRFVDEGKRIVEAKITEQNVNNNKQIDSQVKKGLADNGIDPVKLRDDKFADQVSGNILSQKNKELDELNKLFPEKLSSASGGTGGASFTTTRPAGYEKKKAELEAKYAQINNQIGLSKAYDFAKQNPALNPKDIGEQWLKYAEPDTYKLWVKAGKKGAIDRDIAEIGVRALYGTGQQGAVELAKADEQNLDYQYPDKIIAETYHRLGAELHKDQNWFLNAAPSVKQLDEAAKQLPEKNRDIYYKLIRDYENKNFGTDVPMSGLVNKVGEGFTTTANETWKGLGDLLQIRSDKKVATEALNEGISTQFQDVGASQPAVQRLKEINSKQKKGEKLTNQEITEKQDLEQFAGVRTTAQEIIDGTGNLTGQVLFQAIGTKGLGAVAKGAVKGVGLLKAAEVGAGLATEESIAAQAVDFGISKATINNVSASAIAFASSYDGAKRDAFRLMPDDKDAGKRTLYATIVGGLNAGTERIFKDEKILNAFNKEISPTIKALVGKLSAGEISKEALSTSIANVLKKSGAFLKESAISNTKEATEELATSVGQSIATSILAPAKFNEQQAYNDAISTFTTTFLHGGLVAGAASINSVRSNHIGIPTLSKLGIDNKLTEDTKNFINAQVLNGNMTQEEANGKFKVLNTATKINTEVMPQVSQVEPDLPQKAKEKYSVQLLNEKILAAQADETKDEVLKSALGKKIKESEKIRKQILGKEVFVDDDYSVITADEINAKVANVATDGSIKTSEELEAELLEGLGEEKSKEAIDYVKELADNDLIPETAFGARTGFKSSKEYAKEQPLNFLKFIADQAQGEFEFEGKIISSRDEAIDRYGENIVATAEEFFPKPKTQTNGNEKTSQESGKKSGEESIQESGSQEAVQQQSDVAKEGAVETKEIEAVPIPESLKNEENTTNALEKASVGVLNSLLKKFQPKGLKWKEGDISREYHKAKKEGNNSELVDEVESAIGTKSILKSADDLKGGIKELWMLPYEANETDDDPVISKAVSQQGELVTGVNVGAMHKGMIEDSLQQGQYEKAIEEGRMTANDAKTIIESAGLEVPQDILIDAGVENAPSKKEKPKVRVSAEQVEKAQPKTNLSKEIKDVRIIDGVEGIFNSKNELPKIGTIEEYSEYLDGIFPNSKIKNIIYRTALEEFMLKPESGLIFMTPDVDYSKIFNKSGDRKTVPMVVNVQAPKILKGSGFLEAEDNISILENGKYDAIVSDVTSIRVNPPKNSDIYEVAVPSASQIHILGNKEDIEGFKKWKDSKSSVVAAQQLERAQPKTEVKVDRKAISERLASLLGGNPGLAKSDRANKVSLEEVGIKPSDNITQVIDKLISFGGEFTGILNFLKGMPDISTVKYEKLANIARREGEYVPEANKAELPENRRTVRIGQVDNAYYAVTHEILHFLTLDSDQINKHADPKKLVALRTIYDFVANQKGTEAATSAQYGLTDFREFMVELSMNPEFRKEISDVVATREDFKKAFNLRNPSPDGILKVITDFISDLINKIFKGSSYNDVIDHKKSLLDNAVDLAVELFFAGQDVISSQKEGSVISISQQQGLANAALNNPGLPSSDRNQKVNEFVKAELENGATAADIKGALLDNGFTEEEAQALIDANKPKVRVTAEKQTEGFGNNKKSILNRIFESKNIPEYIKEKFADQLTYNPQSHTVARDMAKAIIKEFGVENSVQMAESGRFNGDVNSLIFAEGIDQIFEREQAATTPEGKQRLAEQWADYSMRYDEAARQKGKFISAVYDFYKKSPLGIVIAERANRDEVFKKWFKNKESAYKEVFKELSEDPEFKQFVKEKVDVQLKSERAVTRMKRRKKIEDIFDSAKFKGDTLHSSLVPPQLWNAAVEVMKQAALAGESIADIIAQGVQHIKDNHTESWDIDQFRKEWEEKLKGVDGEGDAKQPSKDKQQKVLDRFRKKLSGMTDIQKEDVIRRSFKTLVENGALNYDEFKKIVASVMNLGELSPEEVQKISEYVKDVNAVQDAADNALKERSEKSLGDFQKIAKKAERSATELGNIVNSKTDLLQRVRSIIQLNTLGVVSLIKNPIYNVFHQALVRLPKGIIMTGVDQAIYGLSLLSNKITGSAILKPQTNIFLAQKGYFKQGGKGGSEAINQVFTGLTSLDYFQKEIRTSQIKPAQAWRDIWDWKKGDKFLDNAQIADRLIQGTVGIPAEAVARMLNIGDKPFRFAAQAAMAETIATQQFGLKGIDKEIFTTFPKEEATRLYKEKGMNHDDAVKKAEALEKRIVDEGEQAVFQQKNLVMEGLNGLGAMMKNFSEDKPIAKGGVAIAKIVGTLNTPFLKTPLNIFWELFNLVTPEVALAQSAIYGYMAGRAKYKGDSEKASEYAFQAKKWMAHGATGYSLLAAFGYFASIGAISGGGDDDSAKERKGKKTYQKPHALNVAKIMRAFTGGNTRDEDNDLMVDLSWFGAPGMIMNIQADRYENMTQEERDKMSYIAELQNRMHGAAADGLENSIFQGTIAGINAFKQGGRWVNTWVMNQVNVGTNFFQPATFAQFSRGTLPYNPAIKADNFAQELRNNFASRSLLFRAFSGYPPSDITIWGDKAMRNNTGAKGVAFNMLGFDEYNKDTFAEPIFQDFKRTGNSSFFPTDVRPTMTVDGQDKKMGVEQERQFKTLVGQARKSLVAPFINDMATLESKDENLDGKTYNELSDDLKVKALNILYKKGYEAGKAQFKELHSDFQTTKEKEAQEE
jgi:hypothetical protein